MDVPQKEQKNLEATTASLFVLRAELFRKRNDFQTKLSPSISTTSQTSLKLKNDEQTPSKKKSSTAKEAPESITSITSPVSREEELALAKSRAILEAKSKIYDQLMKDGHTLRDDDGEMFLVDFERKVYENNTTIIKEPTIISANNSDKVEYVDSFGRTRLLTRDELEKKQQLESLQSPPPSTTIEQSESEIDRVERVHRDQMREKWEQDMQAIRDKTQLHYQDILFDEKREHGVGYYQFSKDEQKRTEQMSTLNDLRAKTIQEQRTNLLEKEKRHQSMASRLNKIRQRKAKELGIELTSENGGTIDEQERPSDSQLVEKDRDEMTTTRAEENLIDERINVQQLTEILLQPPPPPPSEEAFVAHQQASAFYSSSTGQQPVFITALSPTLAIPLQIDQSKTKLTDEILKNIEENKRSLTDDKEEERKRTELGTKTFLKPKVPSYAELMDNIRSERR
ncbi:unnamed protein product [Didymodactylos carnosus]|uniref:Uncharacterized protein n=1 Tax=Didymodactylos carnosus TaxID=1234261 RepID=A0A813SXP4_9BILA|nr:unnamed protein product [Didymodactylos carnosus]CAF0942924.1 unnamed protein product [Didymodactylos carnosus]CAF3592270.1 unnamed protein product [Didymodactylos carnosus]CAF3717681.1 unnamed protein product [Didymodactylos carnosus]